MAVKTFTTGEVLTAADTNTYLNNGGLVFVKQVTVGTAVATVDITSCFSATYHNYLVSFANIACSTNHSVNAYLLSGTTPTSSGMYGTEFYVALGGTAWSAQLSANNVGLAYISAAAQTSGLNSIAQIQAPNLAAHTRWQYQMGDSQYFRNGYVIHTAATSYDGIRFTPTSGTWTGGTITVYGYRLG